MIRCVIQNNLFSKDGVDWEDIEQDVKIKIWKFVKKGKKVDNLPSYIKKVAYTATVDELRKMCKQAPYQNPSRLRLLYAEMENLPNGIEDLLPDTALEKKEIMKKLKAQIDALSENRKQVLHLYVMGWSVEEICEFLHWDKTKVRHLLYRGIEQLKVRSQAKTEGGVD